MGTISSSHASAALFGKTRQVLLGLFYGHVDQSYYVRQILRAVDLGQGAVQRELSRLTTAGLLRKEQKGHQVYYQANPDSPLFAELKNLVVKTVGMGDLLRLGLQKLADQIQVAFVYGSLAEGRETNDSDIDLMVVGEVTFKEVTSTLYPLQEQLGREINFSVVPPGEFRRKIKGGNHFLKSMLQTPKIFIVGDQRVLNRLGQ